MGGGGGSSNDQQNSWLTQQLMQQWQTSVQETAQATQKQLGSLNLDFLRTYGQTSAMKAAGIPSPFSTVSGGFQTPFASASGSLIGGAKPA